MIKLFACPLPLFAMCSSHHNLRAGPGNSRSVKLLVFVSLEKHSTMHSQIVPDISHRLELCIVAVQVRQRVVSLRDRLDRGCHALSGMVSGHPHFAAEHLNEIAPLVTPLLASPLVGTGSAFDAVVAMADCMPRGLADDKVAIAAALRLVELSSSGRSLPALIVD